MNSDDEPPEWWHLLNSFRASLEKVRAATPKICSFCGANSGRVLFGNAINTAYICDDCTIHLAIKVSEIDLFNALDDNATRH